MAGRKTQETNASVDEFIEKLSDEIKRRDCKKLVEIFSAATGQDPKMWGDKIIGFGKRHYKYANGKPAELCKVGFSPRAKAFSCYLASFPDSDELYQKLGDHKFSGGCLHISKIDLINTKVLTSIVRNSYKNVVSESA